MAKRPQRKNGYSLVELLVATVLFTIIAGTIFSLLFSAQLRYQGDSGLTTAFQQANVAIDQITRDVHSAGYPPPSSFAASPPAPAIPPQAMALPFSWSLSSGYPSAPCTVGLGGTCGAVPGDYDLILETDPGNGNGVQWIRYSLQGTTLMRGMTPKTLGDPVASTAAGVMLPYLDNVMNGPANKAQPIFLYGFDCINPPPPPSLQQPTNVCKVNVVLIVQAAQPDPQTGQFRTVTLTGEAALFN